MGVMKSLQEIYTRIFDRIYLGLSKEKTCSVHLEHDLFDGKEYSIDDFHKKSMVFYDRPCEFYTLFGHDTIPNLRLGLHPKQRRVYFHPRYMMLYDSPVQTAWPETNLAPFKWYTGKNQRSNVMILFCPGWGRRDQSVEEKICSRLQRRHGIDAGLMTVPYQQARTPAGAYTGEYFISSNIFWTIANFRHFVAEIRLLIRYMRAHYDYVGLVGMSSGGFQSLLASNCEDVDFLFPYLTGCQLADITWEGALTTAIRRDLMQRNVSKSDLEKVWSITDEAVLAPHCRAVHRKQYISLYDIVVPTKYQYALWERLGMPAKLELQCGHHSTVFTLSTVADDMAQLIRNSVDVRSDLKMFDFGTLQ